MILIAAIISKDKKLFCSNYLPHEVKLDISKHADDFIYSLSIQDDDVELPYIETRDLRYIYKQTGDLYWLLVTRPESDMLADINLLGRFVCTIMEYGSSETNSSTLTDEQQDLFYRHIWRPWDDDSHCPLCGSYCSSPIKWERDLEGRLQFLTGIRDGNLDESDVNYFNSLITESWAVSAKFLTKWQYHQKRNDFSSDTDSICSSKSCNSISEESVIEGCRLKCRLEDLRIELARIQDPYLRLFARRDILSGVDQDNPISSAPVLKELELDDQSEF